MVLGVSWAKLPTYLSPLSWCEVHRPDDCETELEPHIGIPQVLDQGHLDIRGAGCERDVIRR
jgi:hypothetical protein